MAIRPARTCRSPYGQPWARTSTKRPRKSFVKGAPNSKVRQYHMGVDKRYEIEARFIALQPVQLRDVSLESARQAANKFLEQNLITNYYFQIVPYAHLVLREHSALGVAGADRISKGMKLAFGKPKGRMACLWSGNAVFIARIMKKDLPILRKAFKRARIKLSGSWKLTLRDITQDAANISRKEHAFKKKDIEKPKEPVAGEAPAAGSAPTTAAGKEGEAAAAGKGEAKGGAATKAESGGKTEKK
ncbi:MAG: 50S ribosomal protein L16 [Candidatus Micrarchaeota archaeon]